MGDLRQNHRAIVYGKTIDLLKDDTAFKGIENGISTFSTFTFENPLLKLGNTAPTTSSSEDEDQDQIVKPKPPAPTSLPTISVPPVAPTCGSNKKRKHYEDGRDVQLKVLKKEESIQEMKMENIKLHNIKLQKEIENLDLQKTKHLMEIEVLRRKLDGTSSNDESWVINLMNSSIVPNAPEDWKSRMFSCKPNGYFYSHTSMKHLFIGCKSSRGRVLPIRHVCR